MHSKETIDALFDKLAPLLKLLSEHPNMDLIENMLETVLKLSQEEVSRGDLKILNSAIKEIRYSFKVFFPYQHIPKVTFFGSARTPESAPEYQLAMQMASQMAQLGWMVITGAGDGIMKAGHQGAGKELSIGLNIRLPFEQSANEVIEADSKLINFKYFFTRKLFFLKESKALILFPGGFGTFDEAFECLTLIQTGKSVPIPVVFVDKPGGMYWKSLAGFINDFMLGNRLISPDDLNLFKMTDDIQQGIRHVTDFYKVYHSSRYVKQDLILRLNKDISEHQLELLNQEFHPILSSGRIEKAPLPDEDQDEPELLHLPRLKMHFNRHYFGELHRLIHTLNKFG